MKNNTKPVFKGNLGKLQEIADSLIFESECCWREADAKRRTGMDMLGRIDVDAQHEVMVLSAKAIAYKQVAQAINILLEDKRKKQDGVYDRETKTMD